MRILVSACLLGLPVRYDGTSKVYKGVLSLANRHILIPVCPEQLGGLPTPRPRSEIRDGRVCNGLGENVTENFLRGARATLEIARLLNVDLVIFKSRSPSCGVGEIYDGSFTGNLVSGNGITAELLLKNGFKVVNEDSIPNCVYEEGID